MKRWCLALLSACFCVAASAAELKGSLSLISGGQPLRAGESAEAVIYFRPRAPVAFTPPTEPATMTTRRKQFLPRILAISAGSSVRFPNEDPILHNVFSTSPNNAFDAGLYATGTGALHTFNQAGLVKVYCNVHHAMFGYILVLDTPFFTRTDAVGRFELKGLPEHADGELVVYHDRGQPLRVTVNTGKAGDLNLRMDLDKRKVPPHMNKFGKPYERGGNAGAY